MILKKIIPFVIILISMEAFAENQENKYTQFNKPAKIKNLTPLQYEVTQKGGTEKPFDNPYWNNKEPGIYVDVVSGEPLFSSTDKFDSGTGWPSFSKPIDKNFISVKKQKNLLSEEIVEVKSRYGDSHLGHVFEDGPAPTGKRFCIDSASLKFIPVNSLEKMGYGDYLFLFKKEKK